MPTIDITYSTLPEFRFHPISGGFGGVSPYGQILCSLYHEHGETPGRGRVNVDNPIAPREEPMGVLPVVRDVVFGMQLTPEQALALGNWLTTQANLAIAAKSAQSVQAAGGSSQMRPS